MIFRKMQKATPQEKVKPFFVLCKSCYWTASVLEISKSSFASCPECQEKNVAAVPIVESESSGRGHAMTETRKLELK